MTQALGVAPGLAHLVMFVGSTDSAIFGKMATYSPLPLQLSSSWTWSPADPSTDDPYFKEFAAQGQNLFQAAGDSSKWTTSGTASEIYPADDPYVTSVGGTDLSTAAAAGAWSAETAWADSGGGISPDKYAIPSWQTTAAAGCASCSQSYRNGPDVSANANFTYYVCADQTTCTANEYGGTSFAAPLWAGYLALVNQQRAANGSSALGFINPTLYSIGTGSSYDANFHDITSGSNGYSATVGYDLATGWGSPNGTTLLNTLAGTVVKPGFSLSASPNAVSVVQGNTGSSTITSTVVGGFNAAVTLSASGAPTGVTVSFSPASITGTGNSAVSIVVGSTVAAGTYPITITGTSGATTETTTVSLTVTAKVAASFTISVSPSSGYLLQGQSGYAVVSTTVSGSFNSAITLSYSALPAGVTATFSKNPIAAPGSGTVDFTLTVSKTAPIGTYPITITGTGGGVTKTTILTFGVEK
jgi:kumamolisin